MGSSHFEGEWVLDQAKVALELSHHITPDHQVMDTLVALCEKYPEKVAHVLDLLIEHRVEEYGFHGWVDKAALVLKVLLRGQMKASAVKMIHRLGALGFNQFGELLDA